MWVTGKFNCERFEPSSKFKLTFYPWSLASRLPINITLKRTLHQTVITNTCKSIAVIPTTQKGFKEQIVIVFSFQELAYVFLSRSN